MCLQHIVQDHKSNVLTHHVLKTNFSLNGLSHMHNVNTWVIYGNVLRILFLKITLLNLVCF